MCHLNEYIEISGKGNLPALSLILWGPNYGSLVESCRRLKLTLHLDPVLRGRISVASVFQYTLSCRGYYGKGHKVCMFPTNSLTKCVSCYRLPEYDFSNFLFSHIFGSTLNYAKRASSRINLEENSVNKAV